MPNQIYSPLPSDVPAPKFHLFQEVCYSDRQGVITGMQYICPLEALAASLGRYGWQYDISYIYSKTPELALRAPDSDNHIHEESLHARPSKSEEATNVGA